MNISKRFALLSCLLAALYCTPLHAESGEEASLKSADTDPLIEQVEQIAKALNQGNAEDIIGQSDHPSEKASGAQEELARMFEEIVTGSADVDLFAQAEAGELSWREELQEITKPFLLRLKSLTERPREIEELRRSREHIANKLEASQVALENIRDIQARVKTETARSVLRSLESKWKVRLTDLEKRLSLLDFQLDEKLDQEQGAGIAISQAFSEFVTGRGFNLIIAIFSFVLSFSLLRYFGMKLEKWVSRGQDKESRFIARTTHIVFQVVTIALSVFILVLVLYLLNDWLLLTLVLLFLAALAFTLRNSLPDYISEARLLLNLGPVREGERVVFEGIPWRVTRLNIYSDLVNPRLTGGRIRLPLETMLALHSRRWSREEPWFPTVPGDVVFLNDGTFGTVAIQTPELVQLDVYGVEEKTYHVQEFLGLAPRNLSNGFALFVTFGLDYAVQEFVTDEIPEKLESFLGERIKESDFGEYLKFLKVEFNSAGASSLDLKIVSMFEGQCAEQYFSIERLLQKNCVEACNHFEWNIPFEQLTVHMSKGETEQESRDKLNAK